MPLFIAGRHSASTQTVRSRLFTTSLKAPEKFKILFCGRDEFSCTVFQELHGAEDIYESLDIVTNPDEHVGRRGSILSVSPLKTLGQALLSPVHEIPHGRKHFRTWQLPSPFSDPGATDASMHLIVTASFGRILTDSMINLFPNPLRRLNVHGSLLPKYRGAAPVQHAILNGETETGVSISAMLKRTEGIDAGQMLARRKMAIAPNATYTDLRANLAIQGGKLLVQTLRDVQAGKETVLEQSEEQVTHAPAITLEDSLVDFRSMTAHQIWTRYRAIGHQRPLTARTKFDSTVQIHDLAIATHMPALDRPGLALFNKPAQTLYVYCAEGTAIAVSQLKSEGKRLMGALDWWNGVRGMGHVVNKKEYHFL